MPQTERKKREKLFAIGFSFPTLSFPNEYFPYICAQQNLTMSDIAAELAKLKEYHTAEYPAKGSWMDQFLPSENKGSYLDSKFQQEMKALLGDLYEPLIELRQTVKDGSYIQARMLDDVRMK